MPRLRVWCGLMLLCASPLGRAHQPAQNAVPVPVSAPEQPSAALLEFIGDWNEDERQLIGMENKVEITARSKKPEEVRRAP